MGEAYIHSAAMTRFGKYPDKSAADLGREAILELLRATDIPAASIGAAFFGRSFSSAFDGQLTIAGQVALRGTGIGSIPVFNLDNACTATPSALACAVQFVKGGVHDVVLVVGMDKLFSRDRKTSMRSLVGAMDYGEMSYLLSEDSAAPGSKSVIMDHYYARIADAYLTASGATVEDLARVSVKNRMHASHNPYAQYREPISEEEVLQSPDIAHPLTKLMCSPLSDGAGALLVVSEAVRRKLGGPCARVAATAVQRGLPEALPDDLPLTTRVARRAYEEAGITPGDIDLAEVHDASAAAELIAVEQLELCPAGGAVAMLRDGRSSLGGSVPVNVSGGLLSRGHPGAGTSAAQLVEIVWQLQGSAGSRQVEGARIGIAQSSGGHIGSEPASVAITILEAATSS